MTISVPLLTTNYTSFSITTGYEPRALNEKYIHTKNHLPTRRTSLTYKMPTTRRSTLKQAEEKIVPLSESEGCKGKKKAYEDPTPGSENKKEDEKQEDTPEYLLEEEDETYADYVMMKDLSLVYLSMEAKL